MRWLAAISLLLGTGCFQGEDAVGTCGDGGCGALFAMVTVTVVDAAGRPIDGLVTTSTHVATGSDIAASPPLGNGVYVVVDDGILGTPVVDAADDHRLAFEARRADGTSSVSDEYVVRAGTCSCHVEKLSGPERLVLP